MDNPNRKSPTGPRDNPHLAPLLRKLRPFQREAYEFATRGVTNQRQWADSKSSTDEIKSAAPEYNAKYLGLGRILLADEMGLGKTVSSLAIMVHYMHEWPLLILCPASLKHTWPGEIEKFMPGLSPSAMHIVGGFDDTSWIKNRSIKIVIAPYSVLQKRSAVSRVLQEFNFQCVISDESHNLKERSSQRCQLAMPIFQNAKRLLLLSGTPALARPVELWAQLNAIAPDLFGPSYSAYTKQYCNARRGRFGWDVSGLSNGEELHEKLRQIMVRRLKSSVLDELPPKQRSMVNIAQLSDPAECRALMTELQDTRLSVSEMVGQDANSAHFEARRLLMQAYQQSGVAKAAAVANYLLDWLDGSGTQKILVFCHHKKVMDLLEKAVAKKYKGVGHIRIDGSVDSKERAVRVKKFQTHARARVALLSMTAAGVGLTLTAASCVLFAELHWTPGVLAQAEDRCHRIGQRNSVTVIYCVCKDAELSVDMSLWKMLGRKVSTLGKIIDGCQHASLQAHDANEEVGVSAAEELSNFFADTEHEEKKKSAIPVKGSIMSFFKSAKSDNRDGKEDNIVKSVTPGTASKPTASTLKDGPTRTKSSGSQNVEWACDTCTFENAKAPSKTGWLACDMCQTPHIPQESLVEPVTPHRKDEAMVIDDAKPAPVSHDRGVAFRKEVVIVDVDEPRVTRGLKEIITLDDEDSKGRRLSVVTPAKSEASLFKFSVSKNSGRVTIHDGMSCQSFQINFDVEDVVTDDTADRLLEVQVARSTKRPNDCLKIDFDDDGIKKILAPIVKDLKSKGKIQRRVDEKRGRHNVRDFVSSYLALREVEKKAVKESGKCFVGLRLKQQVSKMMASSITQSTERYCGGAKERAKENLVQGKATERDNAVLEGRACAWCADNLSGAAQAEGVQSTYCSQKCAEQGRLKRGGMYASTQVRAQVFGLEGGVCRMCGIDAHALFTRICALEPPSRLNALINAKWRLPKTGPALERLLQDPKEGDFWNADHIVAVAEGGGGCDLDNLQTLCTPCHQQETNKLRSRLKLIGKPGETDRKRKQVDIRSVFFGKSNKKVKK